MKRNFGLRGPLDERSVSILESEPILQPDFASWASDLRQTLWPWQLLAAERANDKHRFMDFLLSIGDLPSELDKLNFFRFIRASRDRSIRESNQESLAAWSSYRARDRRRQVMSPPDDVSLMTACFNYLTGFNSLTGALLLRTSPRRSRLQMVHWAEHKQQRRGSSSEQNLRSDKRSRSLISCTWSLTNR